MSVMNLNKHTLYSITNSAAESSSIFTCPTLSISASKASSWGISLMGMHYKTLHIELQCLRTSNWLEGSMVKEDENLNKRTLYS